ncbi:hypothetical protein EN943_29550 [Mesorhizobium sp. M7A.F.Ca.US.006.01.1.1]|uniref:hypothetical protein n=1 Tax=Mesorhizobium sp. M7A.F.Ca.US.006.01.1.1 TaxID=2496707 RepID=UPI000FC9AB1B|nr:hypothetical protein [Mesorhizobium sp. M7A.F.Ca.US.006.01.1.1]RUZ72705.1 hypothetical protein EN943_29550 [Mesorhizobium sp. M7A.F.Ca.US.006.01.1.1]
MTTNSELKTLFRYESTTPRIIAVGGEPTLAADPSGEFKTTALTFRLTDTKSKKKVDRWLMVALSAADAVDLALIILQYAERNHWPELNRGERELVEISGDPKSKN